MKTYCLVLLAVFNITTGQAQDAAIGNLNAVSFEIGKTSLMFNLNYDHRFRYKNFGLRAGGGINAARFMQIRTVGGGGYKLFGTKNDFFEFGVEAHYLYANEVSNDQKGFFDMIAYPDYSIKTYHFSANLGYRRYTTHTMTRIGLSPGFIKNGFIPGGYVSFGVTF